MTFMNNIIEYGEKRQGGILRGNLHMLTDAKCDIWAYKSKYRYAPNSS